MVPIPSIAPPSSSPARRASARISARRCGIDSTINSVYDCALNPARRPPPVGTAVRSDPHPGPVRSEPQRQHSHRIVGLPRRRRWDALCAWRIPSVRSAQRPGGPALSLRWALTHMIEETAHHAGAAPEPPERGGPQGLHPRYRDVTRPAAEDRSSTATSTAGMA
ncbi:mycothiol transferase [Nocardia acidivorans]|uniref:mycothiol transferase n=1 Tax=Nocardia acidivorans TaxID=404580 RepID=UPI0035A22E36